MDDLVELERFVRWALDIRTEARPARGRRPAWRFTLAEGVAQRRAIVVQLRESGLTIGQIAAATATALDRPAGSRGGAAPAADVRARRSMEAAADSNHGNRHRPQA